MSASFTPDRPDLRDLFRVFLRIGLLSFGGPAAQIALMHRELVEQRPWLSEDEFLRGLSFCMLLPGPEAMQLCTYTGWRLRGTFGGILAGLLFVLPGAAVIAALVWLYAAFGTVPGVQAAFAGIKAAVIIVVLQALWRLSKKALSKGSDWALAGLGFVGLFFLGLPFPVVVLCAGLFGLVKGQTPAAAPAEVTKGHGPQSPLRVAAFWSILWLTPLALLHFSGFGFLADIGWFFAKLAVVTFGGAYAVLAYMSQTVVEQHGWVTAGQMIDALGLAETTPGPLILVTQFIAMLAGLTTGGMPVFLAAGAVALWATFVPCFLWIFTAAPYVERLSLHPRLGSALKAITAAVTGVILNLSVWFLLHVLFRDLPQTQVGPLSFVVPDWSSLDAEALFLTAVAAGAAIALRGRLLWLLALMVVAGLAVAAAPDLLLP
ncbi:chromate efflux transporter [Phaeobacter gallaeciensis]|nr:chromate efflux transporter [Phaeobacter gallaeciensis]MDE4189898.1 chromate efflux transporter [Phaeobacter gallaeciensis]MDE4199051.1 chromate efflux transporter [Phaeobacter gallaeciensis]MDE4203199.1 chromate efflux transporter [Phaeobacter gallaeciensis]MDE4207341.1 chromate efflux transporter [Phaeobacter gallaeciensis]MDE4215436.1 chromate efflux transporter [Phaeobacter gallaeciensis]